jgi:hypothetical protein
MNTRLFWTHAALALVLLHLADDGHAQAATGAPAVSDAVLAQKSAMVDKVLNESPVAARVLGSGNDEARRHFTRARELAAHARALRADGLQRAADGLLNEAIAEISQAQQLVPDPGAQQAGERARYAQLQASVAASRRTAQIALPAPAPRSGESREMMLTRADLMVEQAAQLAQADRYIEANKQLDGALLLLLQDASNRLAGHTIVYDVRFADRREEFDFELERHRSFERLVPLALVEFRPAPEARALAERYVRQARELRERGEAQFARDPLAAIKDVGDGTDSLRRALQAAGLVVPQTMESP